ncbi:PIN domain-containing protein [Patescibacteria group bacterium]|nr:PIN domain-containing protein [Patescibacteria group bacterium]MBU1256162.1 PIN domain-containing protein [Patescibacteria group bacterium]MBU1457582.1 PIN domain-containing protein [Patescibacteria group bacterium]
MDLILPDTNMLILGLADQQQYGEILKAWIIKNRLVFSPIVVAEFLIGANLQVAQNFNQLVQQFPVLPIDLETAKIAAHIRKTSFKKKKKLILPDCLIAAQCKIHNLTLATLNPKDFPKTTKLFTLPKV